MSDLFVYLIKVNIALIIFCLGYYLVLRHLTFYVLNRVYLVCAIVFATLYPLVDFSSFLNSHEQIARPVQLVIVNWQKPVADIVQHDKWYWMGLVFWAGVLVMAVRFTMQLVALYRLHRQSKSAQLHEYWVRIVQGDVNPFSFWKSIYVNPDNHDANELKAILAHEQVHVNQWHTVDIILGELSTIFYWFNPGVWLMKRAIRENIEFITDQKILQSGSDPKEYQYSLLNVSLQGGHNAIVNHFNVSTIKKRIMMMNTKKSSPINLTRYAFLVPAVIALVLVFSISKAEFKKTVANSNTVVAGVLKSTLNEVTIVAGKTVVDVKRNIIALPEAVQRFITNDTEVKLDTPKKKTITYVGNKEVIVTGYALPKRDSANMVVIKSMSGLTVNSDGSLTKDGSPVTTVIVDGKIFDPSPVTVTGYATRQPSVSSTNNLTYGAAKTVYTYTPANGNNIASINFINADTPKTIQNIRIRNFSGEPLIVINGVVSNMAAFDKLNFNDVESLNVLKEGTAQSKYGDKAGDGVIEIWLKGSRPASNPTRSTQTFRGGAGIRLIPNNLSQTQSNGLFSDKLLIVDGKESTSAEANKIPANKIDKIKMIEAGNKDLEKYGDKAKNGAVIITTK